MIKLTTVALTVALMTAVASAAPMVTYQAADLGGGLTEYIFSIDGDGGAPGGMSTTSLTFEGDIQQIGAFGGGAQVGNETNATAQDGALGYSKTGDSWLFDGWNGIAPDDTNMDALGAGPATGQPIILSVGTLGGELHAAKELVHIVARGPVIWGGGQAQTGMFAFAGQDYDTGGVAVIPEPATMSLMLFGAIGMIARKRRRN